MPNIPRIALKVGAEASLRVTTCHFLSVTQRLGKKTIYGWTLVIKTQQ